jgi:uncharacterized coiled-coil DUF342 family protein
VDISIKLDELLTRLDQLERERDARLEETWTPVDVARDYALRHEWLLEEVFDAVTAERDELRAEVERLRDIAWKHGNRADEAEAEVERLRAENERLSADIQASLRERGSNGGSQ